MSAPDLDGRGHVVLLEDGESSGEVIAIHRETLISLAFHALLALLLLQVIRHTPPREPELRPEDKPPIPIAFIVPKPPAPRAPATPTPNPPAPPAAKQVPPSPPDERSIVMNRPDPLPDPDKPFRMKPAPPSNKNHEPPKDLDAKKGPKGFEDPRSGGSAGGPLPRPTAGSPLTGETTPSDSDGTAREIPPNPPDLSGRLRDFRRALGQKEPGAPTPKGPEGGGKGWGGLDLSNLPRTGMGFGNIEFESTDYDWNDYARTILTAIWRAWHNRMLIGVSIFEKWGMQNSPFLDHRVRVRFRIDRTGQVENVAVETASGCYPLDDSASEALREVVLPPLPDDFPRGQETVRIWFIAEGDIRAMRSTLEYYKRIGLF